MEKEKLHLNRLIFVIKNILPYRRRKGEAFPPAAYDGCLCPLNPSHRPNSSNLGLAGVTYRKVPICCSISFLNEKLLI